MSEDAKYKKLYEQWRQVAILLGGVDDEDVIEELKSVMNRLGALSNELSAQYATLRQLQAQLADTSEEQKEMAESAWLAGMDRTWYAQLQALRTQTAESQSSTREQAEATGPEQAKPPMSNDEINTRIARAMGFDTLMADVWRIGEPTLYIFDPSACRSADGRCSSTRLVGGDWETVPTENGGSMTVWGRPCPNWAGKWEDAGHLFEQGGILLLPVDGGFIAQPAADPGTERLTGIVQADPKHAICFAWLYMKRRPGAREKPQNPYATI